MPSTTDDVGRQALPLPERIRRRLLSLVLFACMAALVMNAFMINWSFNDGSNSSVDRMIEGRSVKPWSSRILMPRLVDAVADNLPQRVADALLPRNETFNRLYHHFAKPYAERQKRQEDVAALWSDTDYQLRYILMYLLCFASLVATLLVQQALVARLLPGHFTASLLAPLAFCCLYPYSFVQGGYFYDFGELLLLSSFLYLFTGGHALLAAAVAVVGAANKETFWLFMVFLLPLAPASLGPRWKRDWSLMLVACLLATAAVSMLTISAPGLPVHVQIEKNIEFWLTPSSYFRFRDNYAPWIFLPSGMNALAIGLAVFLARPCWKGASVAARRGVLLSGAVCLPLLVLACYRDEMRNLSLMFPLVFFALVQGAGTRQTTASTHVERARRPGGQPRLAG